MKKLKVILSTLISIASFAQVSNFEPLGATLGSNKFWNGSGPSVSYNITSGGLWFNNQYSTNYGGLWSGGWAVSKIVNTTLAGYTNQYAAITGSLSGTYAVGQQDAVISFSGTKTITGLQVTNSTYAYFSMKNGDGFARSFSGANNDYFKLTIYPFQNGIINTSVGVNVFLADFLTINGLNTIINIWKTVDLSTLGGITGLKFTLSSSDFGDYGINTPAYFCIDNISISGGNMVDFEDVNITSGNYVNKNETMIRNSFVDGSATFRTEYTTSSYGDYWSGGFAYSIEKNVTLAGSANLYSNITGKGFDNSTVFGVGKNNATLVWTGNTISGAFFTNTTYAYWSMKNGDSFAKKFGGTSGNDPDYFKITIKGYKNGALKSDSVEFFLADFRNSDNSKDYILKDWQWASFAKLGQVDSLIFQFRSSDAGLYGINTPAFFAIDNVNGTPPNTTSVFGTAIHSNNILVYPNPANDLLHIFNNSEKPIKVLIFDILGDRINEQEILAEVTYQINISNFGSGMYLLQTSDGQTIKLIKK
ncbi:MAG: DUF4465 domain-containing protein [Bacteroidota bacterium]|nr:DUF4465 domain-containing protein [Bacteroidota bacterium]